MVSSNAYMWFGIPGSSMQWVPAPQAGFQRSWSGNNVISALDDGRQYVTTSAQQHSQFTGSFFGDYNDPNGVNIDIFQAYASGFYGSGPICFANPYAFQRNLFAPNFATPGLVRFGWASPLGTTGMSFGTQTVAAGRSPYTTTATMTGTAYLPLSSTARYNQYIAIPPGYTLYVGWSGSATGTAGFLVQPYNASDNSLAASSMLTPLSITGSTQTNASFSGSTYNAVRIFATRTDGSTSTISVNSMMARLYPTGSTAPTSYNHVPGQGNLALRIAGDAIPETYNYAGVKKSLNLTLEETV